MEHPRLPGDLVPSVAAGVINAIVCIVSGMALAALVFSGPLAPYLPQGIGIILLGTVIFALLSAFTASHPLIFSAPQDIPLAIIALMAASVAAGVGSTLSADEAFGFVFVAMGLTSIIVGVFFFLLGQFRLGKLVRYIPFPVLGGFLAGTGWLVASFALMMMTGLSMGIADLPALFDGGMILRWLPGLVFALVLLALTRRIDHVLLLPGMLLASMALFYGVAFALGLDFRALEQDGWLLGPFPDAGLTPGLPFEHLPDFRWGLFVEFLPTIAVMMVLNAVALLFNYSGLELVVKRDFDLDRELKITGMNNLAAGAVGTPPGFMTLSESTMSYNLGARSRLPSIVVAVVTLLVMLFGADAIAIFPKVILGGLLLNLGLEFLTEWLWDVRRRLHRVDYVVIVMILIVIAGVGFLEGIFVGLMLSVVLFVINYSQVEVIKHELSGRTFRSNVERSGHLKALLDAHGESIYILALQGFVFFGTANRLLQQVRARQEDPERAPLEFLVFDFRQVTGLDSSAINGFNKLQVLAESLGFRVLYCGLRHDMRAQLGLDGESADEDATIREYPDLDRGLEWCEERIITRLLPADADPGHVDEQDAFQARFGHLAEYFEFRPYPAGTHIIRQGEDPDGITFLDSGTISVMLESDTGQAIRLKTLGAGTVVGEVSLYLGTAASASVVANTDCVTYHLSSEQFRAMNLAAPEKAAELHTFIVRLLSDRLASSNASIQALIR